MFKLLKNRTGQAIFEYAIILGLVVLALGMMQTYLRRGIQAGIKIAADELGRQEDSVEIDPTKGTTQSSVLQSLSSAQEQTSVVNGGQKTTVAEETTLSSGQSEYWSDWQEK